MYKRSLGTKLVRIQGVGWLPGVPANEAGVGDVLIWNHGERTTVKRVEAVTRTLLVLTLESQDGKLSRRRMRGVTLVVRVEP